MLTMYRLPTPQVNGITVGQFEENLRRAGYCKIGYGSFCNTFAAPGSKQIVKVCNDLNADGYMQFLMHVGLKSKNPHFPYIHSVEIYDNEPGNPYSVPYAVIRMERLQERVRDGLWQRAMQEAGLNDICDLAEPSNIMPVSEDMFNVCETLSELFLNFVQDIKSSNVMYRVTESGATLVITDPVACYIGPPSG